MAVFCNLIVLPVWLLPGFNDPPTKDDGRDQLRSRCLDFSLLVFKDCKMMVFLFGLPKRWSPTKPSGPVKQLAAFGENR